MHTVFTIGHSTHDPGTFNELLDGHGVALVVDVRRYPGSRRVPWTNAEEIERALAVKYLHLSELAGRRRPALDSPNGFWRNDGFRGYADHMGSEEFATGLERLLGAAVRLRPAVMCAEGLWWRCHRRLVADALVVRGIEVLHVDPRGKAEPHRLTAAAAVADGRLVYPPEPPVVG